MIVGNPSHFALESEITHAYERLSLRALGFFVIHVGGKCYGVRTWDATMLSNAVDGVAKRIAMRGSHTAPTIASVDAETLAVAFSRATYLEHDENESFLGMRDSDFVRLLHSTGLVWAPDGEEGFDDGSCVLQFDVADKVRLIAFTRSSNPVLDPASLHDIWLSSEEFYAILHRWHERFVEEWAASPKVFEVDQ